MYDYKKPVKDKLRQKVQKYKEQFDEYIQMYGTEKCPYQPRVHGEDISLMCEIVYVNSRKALFEEGSDEGE